MTDANNESGLISTLSSIDPNEGINKEACEKYGITISELPIEPVEPYSRYAEDDTVYGFVTEVSHDQKGTEIEIKDWGYCLEENRIELGFENMLRSQIMEEVIKTYGLVPMVDFTGMPDEVISWDNSTAKSGGGGATGGSGDAEIDQLVSKWCAGKSSELDKAKAIHMGLRDEVGITYQKYYDFNYSSASECLHHANNPGLNCGDTSQLTVACMLAGGLNAYIIFRCDHEHYFTCIEISGQKYYSDLTGNEGQRSTRAWNDTWQHNTCGDKYTR